jgi:hypothetical protein
MRRRTIWLALWAIVAIGSVAYSLPNEVSYTIEAELNTQRNVIQGHEIVEFTNKTGQALDALYFHVYPNAFKRGSNSRYQQELREIAGLQDLDAIYADPNDDAFMTIERVAVRDERLGLFLPLEFSIEDTRLTVELNESLPDGETLTLAIDFVYDLMEAPPEARMAARWAIRSGHRDGVYTIALWYPKLAVYDELGWHLEPYGYLGEFYGDFADYTVQLTVPEGFTVGATGQLELEAVGSGVKTLRFRAEDVHDFAWVAAPNYRVRELEWNGIVVRGLSLTMSNLAERALDALQYFSETFGPYAYPVFTIAEVTVGGGMEYPGIVMIGQGSSLEIVHEVAHQWWYGAVGNDEFNEAWLDEAFSTYAQERYFIEALGYAEASARSTWTFYEPGEIVLQPASAFPSLRAYAQAVYTKGSGILWMLRGLLGAERFDAVLREYYERFTFQNAKTPDFIAVAEDVSGWELDWFFDQWLRTTKTLDFFVGDVQAERLEDGRDRYTVTVGRVGEAIMPVDVRFVKADGSEQMLRWDGQSAEDTFTLESVRPLVRVELDPQRWVLEENRENNVWANAQARLLWEVPALVLLAVLLGLGISSKSKRFALRG